jgi:hypothetical protein
MKTTQDQSHKVCGLLRKNVEQMPKLDMGITPNWTWIPNVQIDLNQLANASPSSEYNED